MKIEITDISTSGTQYMSDDKCCFSELYWDVGFRWGKGLAMSSSISIPIKAEILSDIKSDVEQRLKEILNRELEADKL